MSGKVKRSLQVSITQQQKVQRALIACSMTQASLARELQITHQTVSKFFRGQPVDRQYFIQIGERLNLDWEDLVALPLSIEDEDTQLVNDSDFHLIIKDIRQKIKSGLQEKCGKVRILDMSYPLKITDIYVDIYVSERISGRQRLGTKNLLPVHPFDASHHSSDRNKAS
jgi:transcriptional regulator with XRE-family HTH domain